MFNKNITCTKNVQRQFTKCITGMDNLEYKQRLMVLKLPNMEYRRARGDITETFKLIHSYYDHESVRFLFKLNEFTGTKRAHFQTTQEDSSTNQYGHFLVTEL